MQRSLVWSHINNSDDNAPPLTRPPRHLRTDMEAEDPDRHRYTLFNLNRARSALAAEPGAIRSRAALVKLNGIKEMLCGVRCPLGAVRGWCCTAAAVMLLLWACGRTSHSHECSRLTPCPAGRGAQPLVPLSP
jgi:hypothetical protein